MDVKRGQKKRGDESRGGGGERGVVWSGKERRGLRKRGFTLNLSSSSLTCCCHCCSYSFLPLLLTLSDLVCVLFSFISCVLSFLLSFFTPVDHSCLCVDLILMYSFAVRIYLTIYVHVSSLLSVYFFLSFFLSLTLYLFLSFSLFFIPLCLCVRVHRRFTSSTDWTQGSCDKYRNEKERKR